MTNSKENVQSTSDSNFSDNTYNINENNKKSFDSTVEQSKQSISQALDESKRNINRNLDEARNQIPRYLQEITDTQEQTAQASREIYENFLEYNKQAISSFQSAFTPYYENIHNQIWGNQELLSRTPEIYSRIASNMTENTIAMNRLYNDFVISNVRNFRTAINDIKGYSYYLAEIGKRNTQIYERISRATTTSTNGKALNNNKNINNTSNNPTL